MLMGIQEKNDLQIISFKTLFFEFEEFPLSYAKAKDVICELEKVGCDFACIDADRAKYQS